MRPYIKTKDAKKNKGVSKKEKHKNEEKIDPNDLVVKLTGKQQIYSVKGRRENAISQTGKMCLPVVGVKNRQKRLTTDQLPHIKEKATSGGGTKAMSACTYDQPKKLQDRFEAIYLTDLPQKKKVISPWIPGPFPYIRSSDPRVRPPFRPSGY